MNMLDRFFVYAGCGSLVVLALFLVATYQNERPQTVKCTVARVVDDETDEPVANERLKRPYTVLHHQPAWTVFEVPGDLGEPGMAVYVVPPANE